MEDQVAVKILKELRDFRAENNKRWEENDKRWEANDRRWEANDKRWEANDKRWEENDKRWNENTKILQGMNERITALEENRKKDRNDLVDVLDRMQNSIDKQFKDQREYMDAKFEQILAALRVNEIEHREFREILLLHERKLNFHSARITALEEWKDKFDMGTFSMA